MTARSTCACVTVALGMAAADPALAQPSRFHVSGGYQISRAADQTLPIGWSVDMATNLDGRWSIVGEMSGAYKVAEDEDLDGDVELSLHTFGAGARWSSRVATRVVPFLQVLAGAARVSAHAEILGTEAGDSSTKFMLQPGGGVSLNLNETFSLVGQVDYRRVFDHNVESGASHFRVVLGMRIAR